MAFVSQHLVAKIAAMLAASPLQSDEFRRIEGMGSHYLSLQPEYHGQGFMFSLSINGQELYIHRLTGR